MEIQYLKLFQENPRRNLEELSTTPNTPLSESEISTLEDKWNNGTRFPVVIREFLEIGGKYNWIFEGGDQERLRSSIESMSQFINYKMSRRYIAITCSISDPQYFIVFLDEDQVDPYVYELNLYLEEHLEIYNIERLSNTAIPLSEYINGAVESYRYWQERGLI
jgi:hypothetical protein